jgi:hypothetical protein
MRHPIQNYAALLSKGNKASKFKEQKRLMRAIANSFPEEHDYATIRVIISIYDTNTPRHTQE